MSMDFKIDGVVREIYSSSLKFVMSYLFGDRSYFTSVTTHNGYSCMQLHAETTRILAPDSDAALVIALSDIQIDFTNISTLTINMSFESNNQYAGHVDVYTENYDKQLYLYSYTFSKQNVNINVSSLTGLHNIMIRCSKHNDGSSNTIYKDLYVYEIKADGISIWTPSNQ